MYIALSDLPTYCLIQVFSREMKGTRSGNRWDIRGLLRTNVDSVWSESAAPSAL